MLRDRIAGIFGQAEDERKEWNDVTGIYWSQEDDFTATIYYVVDGKPKSDAVDNVRGIWGSHEGSLSQIKNTEFYTQILCHKKPYLEVKLNTDRFLTFK